MAASDRVDDREPEPGTARAAFVATAEALELMPRDPGREPRPTVADVHLDRCATGARDELYLAAAVTEGVVEHVADRLLHP
jgi:hypothetical protein